ncbi:MAG: transketolase [Deltaproteobacteria bacterium]|nr:transketolase [Candidatus Tharpella aukensis]
MSANLEEKCINTIRFLAVDMVERANSGHPGMPMGAAVMAHTLWSRFLQHNPANPEWPDRDRFILSAGHGSALLYALLHLSGYPLTLDDLKNFRQWGSLTPGHPEYRHTPGVEMTTGPLGQGLASGVGMAMAERSLAAAFNKPEFLVVDHFTYGIVGDGDLMEGISHEAASLAGNLKLGKLIYLYDDNHISIEGDTAITFSEDRAARFRAYGWQVIEVADGNDCAAIAAALTAAREDLERPSLIAVRTHIGFGSPAKQDTASAHGEPLGAQEIITTKKNLGWPTDVDFLVEDDVYESYRQVKTAGAEAEKKWQSMMVDYQDKFPELAAEWERRQAGKLPTDWEKSLPSFPADEKGLATRAVSGKMINALAGVLPELMGGSADLGPSNKTLINEAADFFAPDFAGRNIRFGVREHAMGAVLNGLALHKGLRVYGGTFLVFCDYMKPAIRLAAMMGLPVIYVFTHDSIGLGEDGPTHQPIEHLASLRVIPNLNVIRPADANETVAAWREALIRKDGPTALILTRQNLPTLAPMIEKSMAGLHRGAYVVTEVEDESADITLIGTGSELSLAYAAAIELKQKGILARVVSLPSWELFGKQSKAYKYQVLPPDGRRLAIEAGSSMGWHRYLKGRGEIIAIDHFGASAPAAELFKQFRITQEEIVRRAVAMCSH